MRSALVVVALASLVGASCALRPRYRDFVTATTPGPALVLQMTEASGAPLPNAKVELSEYKNRQQFSTAADGTFSMPVEKKYLDENPVLVVQLPPGAKDFRLAVAPPPPPAPIMLPPPLPASPQPDAPAAVPATPAPPPGTSP
jgi:hypothetical protein